MRILTAVEAGVEGVGVQAEVRGERLQVNGREGTGVFAGLMHEQVVGYVQNSFWSPAHSAASAAHSDSVPMIGKLR